MTGFLELTELSSGKRLMFGIDRIVMVEEIASQGTDEHVEYASIVHCDDGHGYHVSAPYDVVTESIAQVLKEMADAT